MEGGGVGSEEFEAVFLAAAEVFFFLDLDEDEGGVASEEEEGRGEVTFQRM